MVDRINAWFGSVAGIGEQTAFIAVWLLLQLTRWGWDPYPFIALGMILTILSYITNALLMNSNMRQGAVIDQMLRHVEQLTERMDAHEEIHFDEIKRRLQALEDEMAGLPERIVAQFSRKE